MTSRGVADARFGVVIPTRLGSTRLPGKPLRLLAGKSMIQRVYENACEAGADFVIVAAEDSRIAEHVEGFGGNVMLTSPRHSNGTERVAEVVARRNLAPDAIIVNLQGDEPLVPASLLRAVALALRDHGDVGVATLATPVRTAAEAFDPNVVKVVMDQSGVATCFSRAPIPWHRAHLSGKTLTEASRSPLPPAHEAPMLRHVGLYAYRAATLAKLVAEKPCAWERAEALEQLRALWLGVRIHVTVVDDAPGHGVDTEEDLARVDALLEATTTA